MSFSTALPSCSSLWQSEFYLKYCGAAPWAGCWWRQEWSVGAISFQMFHLALDNKIQELTAWKCLGAQCFFTGCKSQGQPFRTGANLPLTSWISQGLSRKVKILPICVARLGLFVGSQDTATVCSALQFFLCNPVTRQYCSCNMWEKRDMYMSSPSLDLLGCTDRSPSELMWGNNTFLILCCLWSEGTNMQSSWGRPH